MNYLYFQSLLNQERKTSILTPGPFLGTKLTFSHLANVEDLRMLKRKVNLFQHLNILLLGISYRIMRENKSQSFPGLENNRFTVHY